MQALKQALKQDLTGTHARDRAGDHRAGKAERGWN